MPHIAIVEDAPEDRDTLIQLLRRYEREKNLKIQVDCFQNGEDFIEDYEPVYDIVLMDIEMPRIDGLEAARKLRQLYPVVCLIFITNMAQFAIHGYEVNALDFILKPAQAFHFFSTLDRAIWNSGLRKGRYLGVDTAQGYVRVTVSDIVYIDTDKHYVVLHTKNQEYRSRGTISELQQKLPSETVARCHSSVLVNLDYVLSIRQDS